MSIEILDLLKLLFACLAGGLIGVEREFRDKSAGFRTLILICLGATLFTMMSPRFAAVGDPGRIAAGIVSGIGFLGAGVILRDRGRIMGLTTAATIWMTAAIGMAIGGGQFLLAVLALALVMAVLWIFPFLERRIDLVRETRTYEILLPPKKEKLQDLMIVLQQSGLRITHRKIVKSKGHLLVNLEAYGTPAAFEQFYALLIQDPDVHEFKC